VIGDTSISTWPYLRIEVNHNWYVDRRAPSVGFVSRDEASILYNTAQLFDGRACLEIGCWRGWSTVHLALGAHSLDSIDPILSDPAIHNELIETLQRAGVEDRVVLHASRSPEGVEAIAARTGKRWSFAFIDGDHDGDSPILDAKVVERFAADDATIILHDLAAPEPAAALAYLRDQGWTTAVYQTMQILGVATRGKCRPVQHIPDPSQKWSLPKHLTSFPVVGESHRAALRRIVVAMGRPAVDIPETSTPLGTEDLARIATGDALRAAEQVANELRIAREGYRPDLERNFDDLHARYLRLARTLSDQTFTQERLETDLTAAHSAVDEARAENHRLLLEQTRLEGLLSNSMRALAARSDHEQTRQLEAAELLQLRNRATRWERKLREAQATDRWFRSRYQMMQAVGPFARKICRPRVLLGLVRRSALGKEAAVRQILAGAFAAQGEGLTLPPRVLAWLSSPRMLFELFRRRLLSGRAAAEGVLTSALRVRLDAGDAIPSKPPLPDSDRVLEKTRRRLDQAQGSLDKVTAQLTVAHRRAEEAERKLTAVEDAMVAEERVLYDAQIELTKLRRGAPVDVAAPAPEAVLDVPR
jgi:predicted O-methyltransferase YrrM